MALYQNKYRIESARRPGYDYGRPGYYFVTIITKNRFPWFGYVTTGPLKPATVVLSDIGMIAAAEWYRTVELRPYVELDEWVVMPNHIHGIFVIRKRPAGESFADAEPDDNCGARGGNVETHGRASLRDRDRDRDDDNTAPMARFGPQRHNLASIVRGFKTAVTTQVRRNIEPGFAWQPRYHDRIIRNKPELQRIRRYIRNNPETALRHQPPRPDPPFPPT